jgi:hypothetical protein
MEPWTKTRDKANEEFADEANPRVESELKSGERRRGT